MTKKNFNVIGIMINAQDTDFKLLGLCDTVVINTQKFGLTSGGDTVTGLKSIIEYILIQLEANTNPRFVIVYDISCPNKEEHIKKLLAEINTVKKNDLLPTLISIGHEPSPWNEDITSQVSIIKEVENTGTRYDLFKNIIRQELSNIPNQLQNAKFSIFESCH